MGTHRGSGLSRAKVATGVLALLAVVYLTTPVHRRDEGWHSKLLSREHAEMLRQDAKQRDLTLMPRKKPAEPVLIPGKDYFADYDVSSIKFPTGMGYERPAKPVFEYVDMENSPYSMKILSYAPRVVFVQDFLTPEEADTLIALGNKSMFRSMVVPHSNEGHDQSVSDIRTSYQAWVNPHQDPVVARVYKKIYDLVKFPDGSGESMQILKYEVGQKYIAHHDYFDPQWYGPQSSNRALTFYLYLTDVEEGGETQFPRANMKPPTNDFTSCVAGLKVRPKRLSAAIFYDMKPSGEFDDHSLHGSCPVKKGTKWGGTLWLRLPTPNGKNAVPNK